MDSRTSTPQDKEKRGTECVCSSGIAVLHSNYLLPSTLGPAGMPGDDDPSVKMWALSILHANQHDNAMIDRWKKDLDGIIVHVRCKMFHRRLRPDLSLE